MVFENNARETSVFAKYHAKIAIFGLLFFFTVQFSIIFFKKNKDFGYITYKVLLTTSIMRNVPWTARLVVIFESLKEIGVSFLVLALAKVHLASTFYTPHIDTMGNST